MLSSNKFSIYHSQSIKIITHIFYWIACYFFMLFVNGLSFKTNLFNTINVLFSFGDIFIIFLIHYFLTIFTIPHVRKRKWGIVFINLLLVYLTLIMGATIILMALKALHPESSIIALEYQHFGVNSFTKIFSYNSALWVLINTIWYIVPGVGIKIIKDFYENLQEKSAIIKEKNTMEINFLRAQIQPHFLFNSLNNIYGLVIDNEPASEAVLQLSNLLRFTVHDSKKDNVTLKEEIVFLTNYILLEKIRHNESQAQINYDFEKIENGERLITPLILVNFIENAFKHGINASIKKMWVNIEMVEERGLLTFRIVNNKPSLTAESRITNSKSSGIGLSNVRRRLELEYQGYYSLDIKETEDIYEVVLVIKLHP